MVAFFNKKLYSRGNGPPPYFLTVVASCHDKPFKQINKNFCRVENNSKLVHTLFSSIIITDYVLNVNSISHFFGKKDGMRRVCLRIMRLPLAIFGVR